MVLLGLIGRGACEYHLLADSSGSIVILQAEDTNELLSRMAKQVCAAEAACRRELASVEEALMKVRQTRSCSTPSSAGVGFLGALQAQY